MNSWPAAFTYMNGQTVKLWDVDVLEDDKTEADNGTIIMADKKALIVKAGRGAVKINELQLQGKKRMKFDEFLRGSRWEAGMKFE